MALGRSLDLIVPEELRDRHWAGFHAAMARAEASEGQRVGNLPVRLADGTLLPFPGRLSILAGPRGEPAGAVGVFGERAGDETPFSPVRPLPAP